MIENFDWNSILCGNIDVSWYNWHDQFQKIMEECNYSQKIIASKKKSTMAFQKARYIYEEKKSPV